MPDLLPQDLLRGCPETWLQPQAEKRCKRGNYNEFNYLDQALSIPDFLPVQTDPQCHWENEDKEKNQED